MKKRGVAVPPCWRLVHLGGPLSGECRGGDANGCTLTSRPAFACNSFIQASARGPARPVPHRLTAFSSVRRKRD